MVSNINRVKIYDVDTLKEIGDISIELLKGETREPNMVLGLKKSDDEEWVAIISGRNLIMNE